MRFDLGRALRTQAEGKAIAFHPALRQRVPTVTYSPGASRQDSKLSQREADRHLQSYGGDEPIDWLMDCVRLYQDAVSTADWQLKKSDGTKLVKEKTKGTPPDYQVGPADLYELLETPNPFMLWQELVDLLLIDLLLVGNAYWFKWQISDDKPLALYRLTPGAVKVIPGPYGPKGYEYQPPGARKPLTIALNEVVHYRLANPHSAYYGLGIVQGGARAFDLELAATETMASYYENKADPSMIVQSERRIPRDVRNKLQQQLRSRSAGTRNAGHLMVLEAGLKASTLTPSARDALFAEIANMSRDRIYSKFRASAMLFGQADESGGGNKIADARREFDNYTIRPLLKRLALKISHELVTAWDVEFAFTYFNQLAPDEASKIAGDISAMPGVKVREIRKQYTQFGIEESTGDSEVDEMMLNLPGEDMNADGQPVQGDAAFADRPVGSEAGRPPLGENTRAFPAGAQARAAGKSLSEVAAILEAKALSEQAPVRVGRKLPGEKAPSDARRSERDRDVDAVALFIREGLTDSVHTLERELLDHAEGKAFKPNDLVKRIRNSGAWSTFQKQVEAVLEEGARRAISASVTSMDQVPDSDLDYDAIAKSVVHRPEGIRGIVKTMKDRVANHVKQQLEKEEVTLTDVQATIANEIAEWRTGQAETIAMSEAVHAYNEGTLSVAEELGISEVYVTDGDDHDEPCQEANGSVWDIAHARDNRLEHPNCRRAFLLLT